MVLAGGICKCLMYPSVTFEVSFRFGIVSNCHFLLTSLPWQTCWREVRWDVEASIELVCCVHCWKSRKKPAFTKKDTV